MIRLLFRRHALFATALLAGAALRAVAMLGFRPVLWFPDSYQYVGVALRLQPYRIRPGGYSGLLAVLEPFGSFALVTAVHHLLGLAVAVILYALLRRWDLPAWLATAAVIPQLLDGNQVQIEHMVLSEALFTFLIASGLAALLWNHKPSLRSATAAGLLLAAATLVRGVGLPVLALAGTYLLLRRPGWRATLGAGLAAALPLLAYAAWFHSVHGRFTLATSSGVITYSRVALFADCDRIDPPRRLRVLCESTPPHDRGEVSHRYIWTPSPLNRLPGADTPRLPDDRFTPERNGPAGEFARLAIAAQPGDYLRLALHDFARTFAWSRQPFPDPGVLAAYEFSHHPLRIPEGKVYVAGASAQADATAYERGSAETRVVAPYADWMIAYQRRVTLRGPMLAALLVIGATSLPLIRRRMPTHGAAMFWVASMLLLLVPPFLAQFDHRYVLPAIPLAAAAVAWSAHLLVPLLKTSHRTSGAPVPDAVRAARSGSRRRAGSPPPPSTGRR